MSERPILMSGPLVRAVLERRKTQTRRLLRFPANCNPADFVSWTPERTRWNAMAQHIPTLPSAFGEPGDHLWVRETWRTEELDDLTDGVRYAADNGFQPIANTKAAADAWVQQNTAPSAAGGVWRPSIHMPRWASRITLEITASERVERIQDITEEDARAEGLPRNWPDGVSGWTPEDTGWLTPVGWENAEAGEDCDDAGLVGGEPAFVFSAREAMALWWDHINADRATWASNPWVRVVTFKLVTP